MTGTLDGKVRSRNSDSDAATGIIDHLRSYIRGMLVNSRTKECRSALNAIADEMERLHPEGVDGDQDGKQD